MTLPRQKRPPLMAIRRACQRRGRHRAALLAPFATTGNPRRWRHSTPPGRTCDGYLLLPAGLCLLHNAFLEFISETLVSKRTTTLPGAPQLSGKKTPAPMFSPEDLMMRATYDDTLYELLDFLHDGLFGPKSSE